MTKPRFARAILAFVFLAALIVPVVASASARGQSSTPTPSASPTVSVEAHARNAVTGLFILTACAAGGYYLAKWIRGRNRPRPPGPWFGGGRR